MNKLKFLTISILLALTLVMAGFSGDVAARPLGAFSPGLGAAEGYSILGASTVTNTGLTTTNGAVGVTTGTSITGFPPGVALGGIHSNDASAVAAMAANLNIFGALDQTCTETFGAVDLATVFPSGVAPGVYCSTSTFSLNGNLNLTGTGIWIFKSGSSLITAPGSMVTGGDPCNVWWRVGSSATLGTNSAFIGSIFALTSVTINTGAHLNGRALVQTGQVSLDANTIFGPVCAVQATINPPTLTATITPTVAIATATATSTPTSTATIQPGLATATSTATIQPVLATATTTPTIQPELATATTTVSTRTPTTTMTNQPVQATATLLPRVTALPGAGGIPIQTHDFSWVLVILGGIGALALVVGLKAYRSH